MGTNEIFLLNILPTGFLPPEWFFYILIIATVWSKDMPEVPKLVHMTKFIIAKPKTCHM